MRDSLIADFQFRGINRRMNKCKGILRCLAGSNVLGLFLWDVHGNITEANDAFLNMVGYTREELLSGRLRSRDITPEEYRCLDEKGLRDLAETGACAPFEKEYVRKDGSRVPILFGAIMLEGSQHSGISFVLDLTDRDKVRKALSESEAQREAILEASFDCIITIDHEGKILEFNPAAENTFGYRRSEVIGKEIAERIIPSASRERHWAGIRHALAAGEERVLGRRIEITAMRADGSEFPAELKMTRLFLEGPPAFTGVIRDISERKWIEQERHRLSFQERIARTETEEARRHMAFLSEAGTLLASSLDYETTLAGIARLAVPYLADGCIIDILEENQMLRRLAVAATDPAKEALGRKLFHLDPSDLNGQHPIRRVLQTGKSIFLPEITDEMLVSVAWDDEHLKIARSLGLKSAILAPLRVGERTLGAISFVLIDSGRRYRTADVELAEYLAQQAGAALQNARRCRGSRNEIRARKRSKERL